MYVHDDEEPGSARARAEWTVLRCFFVVRFFQLLNGVVCTFTAWRSYRRPRLVLATLAAAIIETGLLARHCSKRRAFDEPTPALIDVAVGVGGLVALAAGTTIEDRTAWVNWMCPFSYGSVAAAAGGLGSEKGSVAAGVLGATYLGTAATSIRAGGSLMSTAAANTLSYVGFFVAADTLTRQLRRSAIEIEEARRTAVERGERLAGERERNRQHRLLHDSALQVLEGIAHGWIKDHSAQAQAARGAADLRRVLRGQEKPTRSGIGATFEALVLEFAERGLSIELVLPTPDLEPAAPIVEALHSATREALMNVVKHANTPTVVVRVAHADQGLEVTIRDHGSGFDTSVRPPGFGITHSIEARTADIGGNVDLWSQPGRGTRVRLWCPHVI